MKTKSYKLPSKLPQLVERGFALHQQLALLNEEFKGIKDKLKEEALKHPKEHFPLLEKDSDGTQWIVLAEGCECRVVFPEAKIQTDFDPGDSDFLTIRSLAGDHFKSIFRKITLYRPADKKTFRSQVKKLLPLKTSRELLELCSSPSEPKTVWKARAK